MSTDAMPTYTVGKRQMNTLNIRIPSGKCPVKPEFVVDGEEPPDTVIIDWFWRVRDWGYRKGENLLPSAMIYWASYDPHLFGAHFKYAIRVLKEFAISIGEMDPEDKAGADDAATE